ncbi:MAG: ABC transporter substrate-binding protein [Deltaproteobacteria bacterium]|nr:ABC transporter substrate-binding protein [Deltaproteobacteria bacterium]
MMPFAKSWSVGLVVVLSGVLLPSAGWTQMKARVAWTSFASNMSGTWVAQEEGLFKKNGLEVELVHIPSTSRAIQVMLAGELHYSYMDGRNSVTAALKGTDVTIVAGVANRLVFSFMSRPEIKSFAEMKGKKIGITRLGSSTHSVTLWVMTKAGIKPEEYQMLQLVDVPNILTAMIAGQVDAGALSPPTNFRARKSGLTELMDVTKEGPEYVSVAIGSTRSFIKANEELTRRFVRGYSEGVQLLKANKAAGIRAIQKYARIKDPEILEATYGEARAYIETIPYVTRKGLETIIGELLPTEPKAKTAKPEDFLDTRFVAQLEKDGFYKVTAK